MKKLSCIMFVLCALTIFSNAQAGESHHAYLGQSVGANSFLMSAEGICKLQAETTARRGCAYLEQSTLAGINAQIDKAIVISGNTFAGSSEVYCQGSFTYTCQ